MLGVHAAGLAAGDAEERGVKLINAVDKAAATGDHRARALGGGVVPNVDVPAVGGHLPGGVLALSEQAPQRLGGVRAGQTAGHAHDRDRLLRAPDIVHSDRGGVKGQLGHQPVGEAAERRLIHEQGRGHPAAQGQAEAALQLHRHQRVQAHLEEALVDGDRGVGAHRGDGPHLGAKGLDQQVAAALGGGGLKAQGEISAPGDDVCVGCGDGGLPQLREQGRGAPGVEHGAQAGPVHVGHAELALGAAQEAQTIERVGRAQAPHPDAGELSQLGLVRHARLGPHTPVEAQGRATRRHPAGGEAVLKGVGRRVGGETLPAPQGGDRREQPEQIQLGVAGELVQGAGPGHLRPQGAGEGVGVEALKRAALHDPGGVNDAEQARELAQHLAERRLIGDIHGEDLHLSAALAQGLDGLQRLDGGPAATQERDVPRPLRKQPPRDPLAQAAQAAGDEHPAVGVDLRGVGVETLLTQPGDVAFSTAPRDLLPVGHGQLSERQGRIRVRVEVNQATQTVGVL